LICCDKLTSSLSSSVSSEQARRAFDKPHGSSGFNQRCTMRPRIGPSAAEEEAVEAEAEAEAEADAADAADAAGAEEGAPTMNAAGRFFATTATAKYAARFGSHRTDSPPPPPTPPPPLRWEEDEDDEKCVGAAAKEDEGSKLLTSRLNNCAACAASPASTAETIGSIAEELILILSLHKKASGWLFPRVPIFPTLILLDQSKDIYYYYYSTTQYCNNIAPPLQLFLGNPVG
jgi:AhpD family alkylhydroperoxidase